MKIYTYIVLVFISFYQFSISGQSGFYGRLNSLDISYSILPTIKKRFKISPIGTYPNNIKNRSRFLNHSFEFGYDRVVGNKVVMGLNYNLSIVLIDSDEYYPGFDVQSIDYTSYKIDVDNLIAPSATLSFDFKFFRAGCIAPVGKFLGIEFGSASTNWNIDKFIGILPGSRTGQIVSDIQQYYELRTFFIKGLWGKNVQLSDRLILNLESKFNLIGIALHDWGVNYSFEETIENLDDLSYGEWPEPTEFYVSRNKRSNLELLSRSVFAYHRFAFKFGLNYSF